MTEEKFLPLLDYRRYTESVMIERASEFYEEMRCRRTIRDFSDEPVDRRIIENCIRAAGRAPSGANQQPWKFVVVSDIATKQKIRAAAEKVELSFYHKETTEKWRDALKDLKTGPRKEFLDTAPYLIAIFAENYSTSPNGEKTKHYYVKESVGIATGILITALHRAGLASLTYTPVNMTFLNKILVRPSNEKAFMILVAGYPSDTAGIPDLKKKKLDDFVLFI